MWFKWIDLPKMTVGLLLRGVPRTSPLMAYYDIVVKSNNDKISLYEYKTMPHEESLQRLNFNMVGCMFINSNFVCRLIFDHIRPPMSEENWYLV
jgi:hypothetical protein